MKNLFDLTGKVAVVTGASSGLGADAALAYAEAGADVAILARRVEKLNQVKADIEKTGRNVMIAGCDVTKEESVKAAVQQILDRFGHIDILLNNAGIAVRGSVDSMSEEEWDKSFNTNVKAFSSCPSISFLR